MWYVNNISWLNIICYVGIKILCDVEKVEREFGLNRNSIDGDVCFFGSVGCICVLFVYELYKL